MVDLRTLLATRKGKIATGIVATALLLLLSAAYQLTFNPDKTAIAVAKIQHALFRVGEPGELANAVYLLAPWSGSRLHYAGTSATPERYIDTYWNLDSSTYIVDFDRVGDTIALLMFRFQEKTSEIRVNGELLVSNVLSKRALAFSPDTTMVAYAEAVPGIEDAKLTAKDWFVVVRTHPESKEVLRVKGFAGVFLNNETLLYLASDGVKVVSVATGKSTVFAPATFESYKLATLARSKDGTLVAWTDKQVTTVYKVERVTPLKLQPISELLLAPGGSITLTNTSMYQMLYAQDKDSVLWRRPLNGEKGELIFTFPKDLRSIKMIP